MGERGGEVHAALSQAHGSLSGLPRQVRTHSPPLKLTVSPRCPQQPLATPFNMPVRIAEDEGKLLIPSPKAEDDTSFARSDDDASVKRSVPEVRRLAALLAVPLLWGTFTPSMKLLLP